MPSNTEPHPTSVAHPGAFMRVVLDEGMRMSVSDAARQLGVSRQHLHKVLTGRAAVTPEMALRVGRLMGNGPRLWLNMQLNYDLAQARLRQEKTVRE